MQNKSKTILFIFTLSILLSVSSCRKDIEDQQVYKTANHSEIVHKIIKDSNFYQLIYLYITESDKILLDTNNVSIIQQSNQTFNLALSRFLINNPSFVFSSHDERRIILQSVADSFKSKSQLMHHPNKQIVDLIEKLNINNLSNDKFRTYSNVTNVIKVQKSNSEDILECAIGALAGVIGSYGDTINDIRKILRSGISMRLAIDLSLDLIQNASPWWKVGSIALSFAACMYFN